MKAITVLEPWASLIACGAKKIETRSWETKYRGKIAIHAGMQWRENQKDLIETQPFKRSLMTPPDEYRPNTLWQSVRDKETLGKVIAIADLVDCLEVVLGRDSNKVYLADQSVVSADEVSFGNYPIGGYAWLLENVQPIDPLPAKGQQRIWNWWGSTND